VIAWRRVGHGPVALASGISPLDIQEAKSPPLGMGLKSAWVAPYAIDWRSSMVERPPLEREAVGLNPIALTMGQGLLLVADFLAIGNAFYSSLPVGAN
jgi:hypothetical protein